MFETHSIRSASTSAAKTAKNSFNTIYHGCNWVDKCYMTFSKFYDKPVISESHNSENFAPSLLRSINIT